MFLYYQIVFVGPFEHHSNLLPWKELGAEVIKRVHFKSLHALYDRVVFNKVLNLNPEILLWLCGTRLYDWLRKNYATYSTDQMQGHN